ncbi:MAG: type II toxin-antitoxin system HicA family toxin [Hyphomicrobiales bacterium]
MLLLKKTFAIRDSVTYIAIMNSKHKKTLSVVFGKPTSGTIDWADIEALLIAAGVEVVEGSGSRVRFRKGDETEIFHRPHPGKEAKRYQVKAARDFLIRIGVTP